MKVFFGSEIACIKKNSFRPFEPTTVEGPELDLFKIQIYAI